MKITIDNEEVLCNKDFTINEEMLNTSSVILNNVYPATWEQDKNYVSRFYYPKDYSKCKIFNEIEHPEEKSTAEGTSFSINVDLTKEYQVQTLKGQTTQSGTPTPSSPIPINITTGRQVVNVVGKNLANTNNIYLGKSINSNDGTLFNLNTRTTLYQIQIKPNTSYYVSLNSNYYIGNLVYYKEDKSFLITQSSSWGSTRSFTTPSNAYYISFAMKKTDDTAMSSSDIDNLHLQLELGNQSTTYEEYKGNDYEINLGKNLLPNNATTTTINGITYTINEDKSIKVNGTANGRADLYLYGSSSDNGEYLYIPKGNYTLNIQNITNGTMFYAFREKTAGTRYQTNTNNGVIELLAQQDCYFYGVMLAVESGRTITNMLIYPQLEKGTSVSSYSPYKTPIYLGKIGTYQDYIFKNTTENPLYDSNLEEGQWYIHKEVNRTVITDDNKDIIVGFTSSEYGHPRVQISKSNLGYTSNWDSNVYLFNKYSKVTSTSAVANGTYAPNFAQWGIYIYNDDFTSLANARSVMLGTIIYNPLATPTNTLIEDEELINQLNSIELLEGLNNVSVSSANLPFIMSLLYNYVPEYTEEDLLFCGVVENTGNVSLNPRYPHYCNLQVLDFKTFLSEGETLDFVIYEKTILEAINQVIGTISDYGFVLGNINILHEDEVIGAYSTKDKTAYDVFNYIADITQSRWTTRMVDENIVAIDFYDPSLMPHGTAIDYTQEWFCNNKIIDMSFSYSSRDYRNKQVMLSGEVYANIETTEVIIADGYQTQFNTIDKIGYVSSILLNGNPATIITKEEYNLGYEGDFIYQPGNQYFESVDLISTGAVITIVYFAIIEGREIVLNQEEISRVSNMTDRKGIIARYENRNDATTTSELQAIGQSYLKYKGSPEVSLKIDTLNNIWNIGEKVSFSAPLTELTTEYMVKKKTINYITTQDNIFYSYELSSNFNSETEINYFDNQRSKMMGNIGQGEYISRNIDIENTANIIFYDLEVEEVQLGDNTLQSELQTTLGVE